MKTRQSKSRKSWSPQEEHWLAELCGQGKTVNEIALILRRTRRAVSSKKTQLGLHTRSEAEWTPAEDALLKELVGQGKTGAEMADIIGRSTRAVYNRKANLKLYTVYKFSPRDKALLAQIIKFKMAGWKIEAIASVFGVHAGDVSNVLCENGFKGFLWQRPKRRESYQFWSETEVSLLRMYLARRMSARRMSVDQIAARMPDRTPTAIQIKLKRIGTSESQPILSHEDTRRTPEALNQEVRRSLSEHPNKSDTWHAQQHGTLEKTIQMIRSGIRMGLIV